MFSTATRISFLTLALGLTVAVVPARAQSQNSGSSLVKASGGEPESTSTGDSYKFNTDSVPSNTDRHQPMKFNDPGDTPLGTKAPEYVESAPEEAPFKAYIGYPKNQIGLYVQPMNLSSKWSFNGRDFNFAASPLGIGADYRLQFTPQWDLVLDYMHYSMSAPDGTVSPYTISSSSQAFDTYSVGGNYCFLGLTSFFRQFCGGLSVGNDAYPILKFVNSLTNLQISEVQDIVIGLNLAYKQPFADRYMLTIGLGYNYGTGIGNSGALTSKNNSSYYGRAGVEYNLTEHNTITADAMYMARVAKISGLQGSSTQTWETDSSTLGLRLGYLRTF